MMVPTPTPISYEGIPEDLVAYGETLYREYEAKAAKKRDKIQRMVQKIIPMASCVGEEEVATCSPLYCFSLVGFFFTVRRKFSWRFPLKISFYEFQTAKDGVTYRCPLRRDDIAVLLFEKLR